MTKARRAYIALRILFWTLTLGVAGFVTLVAVALVLGIAEGRIGNFPAWGRVGAGFVLVALWLSAIKALVRDLVHERDLAKRGL